MSPVIRVDEDVKDFLVEQAIRLGIPRETFNNIIREFVKDVTGSEIPYRLTAKPNKSKRAQPRRARRPG